LRTITHHAFLLGLFSNILMALFALYSVDHWFFTVEAVRRLTLFTLLPTNHVFITV
jgi:hypothetical protein